MVKLSDGVAHDGRVTTCGQLLDDGLAYVEEVDNFHSPRSQNGAVTGDSIVYGYGAVPVAGELRLGLEASARLHPKQPMQHVIPARLTAQVRTLVGRRHLRPNGPRLEPRPTAWDETGNRQRDTDVRWEDCAVHGRSFVP